MLDPILRKSPNCKAKSHQTYQKSKYIACPCLPGRKRLDTHLCALLTALPLTALHKCISASGGFFNEQQSINPRSLPPTALLPAEKNTLHVFFTISSSVFTYNTIRCFDKVLTRCVGYDQLICLYVQYDTLFFTKCRRVINRC